MKASIFKPGNKWLAEVVDYFLFLENKDGQGSYRTFANQNICLALYRNNHVTWNRTNNTCSVLPGNPSFLSKLYGFHKLPFNVEYKGQVEQICIIFKTTGLSLFSRTPIDQVEINDDPFCQLFGQSARPFQEKLFSAADKPQQVALLENFLLQHVTFPNKEHATYINMYHTLDSVDFEEKYAVQYFTRKHDIDPSTLYRNFKRLFGQSPKEIYKVMRFRKSLHSMLSKKHRLTETAYVHNFTDQSHLNKDFKKFTGESPKKLLRQLSDVQGTMIWSKS